MANPVSLLTASYEVYARLYKQENWILMILPANVAASDLEQVREALRSHIRVNAGDFPNILYEGANYRIVKITREVIEEGGPV